MHEYSVTKNIVDIAISEAKKVNASKIKVIKLVIGDISTIIDESVQMYFEFFTEDTIANGAKLEFKRIKAEFICKECNFKFNKEGSGFDCPKCGKISSPTGVGREFYVESIEIE
jgi:hydrogenase nickel incorporation protein HypA/HybF